MASKSDQSGHFGDAGRHLLRGLVALALACVSVARAECIGGGTSPEVFPEVSVLRSYRPALQAPARIAFAPEGVLYVTDPIAGRVVGRAEDGRVVIDARGLGSPTSVAADARGRVFVGDANAGRVTAYDASWSALFSLGQGHREFQSPTDIAVHEATGTVYVADARAHQVRAYDSLGRFLHSFGTRGAGDGQFEFPGGIHVDAASSEVLVVDQFNFRVQVFSLEGAFLRCFGTRPRGFFTSIRMFDMPQGLWVDGQGRIYVTDALVGVVKVLDRSGNIMGTIGTFGTGSGQLQNPTDLAMDRFGRLFVASASGARLEVFGIGNHADPERFAPATVRIDPARMDRRERRGFVDVWVEVPGYEFDALARRSVTVNGVRGFVGDIVDRDGDGMPELRVRARRAPLLARLPDGISEILVEGPLGPMRFSGRAQVEIFTSPPRGRR